MDDWTSKRKVKYFSLLFSLVVDNIDWVCPVAEKTVLTVFLFFFFHIWIYEKEWIVMRSVIDLFFFNWTNWIKLHWYLLWCHFFCLFIYFLKKIRQPDFIQLPLSPFCPKYAQTVMDDFSWSQQWYKTQIVSDPFSQEIWLLNEWNPSLASCCYW